MSFTGSTEIGRLIAAQSAPTVKRLIMELGGHAPLIVFADADLEKAVDDRHGREVRDLRPGLPGGEPHLCRALRSIRRFLAPVCRARSAALKVGSGLTPDVEIGPLMHAGRSPRSRARSTTPSRAARAASSAAAGIRAGELFYQPTLLADVPDDALIMREETFGPVAAVTPFDAEDEVVARANDTEYGLVAYLVTKDADRIARMTAALEYGMVAVNRVKITGAPIPFGGVKQSGLGREGSRHGLEAFTDLKYVCQDVGLTTIRLRTAASEKGATPCSTATTN